MAMVTMEMAMVTMEMAMVTTKNKAISLNFFY
jgi:hypothetical protein